MDRLFLILEIFLIAMIPTLTFGWDYFEETELYNQIFQFDKIELFINTFSIVYSAEYISITEHDRQFLDRESEPETFDRVWDLIKKKSLHDFPDMHPKIFYTLPIQNTPYSEIEKAEIHYIPDYVFILVGSCAIEEWGEYGLCTDAESVGLIRDIKDWLDEEKNEIRNSINFLVGIMGIVIGLMLVRFKRNTTVL